jgi:cyanophycinase
MNRTSSGTFVAIVITLLSQGWLLADDNLIGLPTPNDPRKPGAVMLHGGGRIDNDVFDRFVELAGGAQARIVLVPSAGFRPTDYDSEADFLRAVRARYGSWVALPSRGQARHFQFLYTDDPDDADDASFVKPLETATGVWFSGGAQGRLNYRYVGNYPRKTLFQTALRGVIERGGIVGGTSAGCAAQPEIMTMNQEQTSYNGPAAAVSAHGLGLFNRAIVEQHFDGRWGRLERFTNLLRDNARLDALAGRAGAGAQMIGLGIEERTALIASGNRLEVRGTGTAHVFIKSHVGRSIGWHMLGPGETAQLRRDVREIPTLQREELMLSR